MSSPMTIVATGRLVRDLEEPINNQPYKSGIAIDSGVRLPDGKYETKFIDITIWPVSNNNSGSKALSLINAFSRSGNIIKKGALIQVTGELKFSRYKKDGEDREGMCIEVDRIEFIKVAKDTSSKENTSGNYESNSRPASKKGPAEMSFDVENDVPSFTASSEDSYDGLDYL